MLRGRLTFALALLVAAGCGSADETGERARCELTAGGGIVWIEFSRGQVVVTRQGDDSEPMSVGDFPTFDGVFITIPLAGSESILFVGPPGAAAVELESQDGRQELTMEPCGPTAAGYIALPAQDDPVEALVRDAEGAFLTDHEVPLGHESGVLGGRVGGPPPTG
jgi:hypothetical protein